jgi:hypothetical protein
LDDLAAANNNDFNSVKSVCKPCLGPCNGKSGQEKIECAYACAGLTAPPPPTEAPTDERSQYCGEGTEWNADSEQCECSCEASSSSPCDADNKGDCESTAYCNWDNDECNVDKCAKMALTRSMVNYFMKDACK